MPYIIRRGGYGPKTYWAGFKQCDGLNAAPAKPRLRWSKLEADAISFHTIGGADAVRIGLRMWRLNPRTVATNLS
jgi:hypothetical protein